METEHEDGLGKGVVPVFSTMHSDASVVAPDTSAHVHPHVFHMQREARPALVPPNSGRPDPLQNVTHRTDRVHGRSPYTVQYAARMMIYICKETKIAMPNK